jgi:hypothetical protein
MGKVYVKYTLTKTLTFVVCVSPCIFYIERNMSQQSNNIKLIAGQRGNLLVLFNKYKFNQNIKYVSLLIIYHINFILLLDFIL